MPAPLKSPIVPRRTPAWLAHNAPSGPAPFDKDWLLALAYRLQFTLEVHGLLEMFVNECAPAVPFDSAHFEHLERKIELEFGTRSTHSCAYTLLLSEQTLGKLTYTRAWPFSEADAARLEFLTSQLVYPLRNALLYHEALVAASRDPLTKTNNRATFDMTLTQEVSLAQRHGTPLSLVILDIDRFKEVNDQYGHAAGDCVLRAFAERVGRCVRASDVLFRYGGEEFVIVLRSTDLPGARHLAERVRRAVADMRVDCGVSSVRFTVSAGVANLAPGDDARALLAKADKALYRSKAEGRNRVTAA
jgi:diguanylate cyclase (GGDEF)-like protein